MKRQPQFLAKGNQISGGGFRNSKTEPVGGHVKTWGDRLKNFEKTVEGDVSKFEGYLSNSSPLLYVGVGLTTLILAYYYFYK